MKASRLFFHFSKIKTHNMKRTITLLAALTLTLGTMFAQTAYELVWVDDFNDATLNATYWNIEEGGSGWGNQELQNYTNRTENVRLENGNLVIEAKKEVYPVGATYPKQYPSGRITTNNKLKTPYGKIEARMSLPAGAGTWPAFWMMPNNNVYGAWPRSGEIDIMEHVGYDPTMISYAVHTYNKNGSKGNNWFYHINDNVENTFHLYGIEWMDDRIAFYYDGVKQVTLWRNFADDYKGWPFDQDFFVIFNMAIGGKMGGTVNDNIFNTPVKMEVDYVKVYKAITTPVETHPAKETMVEPNPFDNQLNIATTDESFIEMFDGYGKLIKNQHINATDVLNTTDLKKGLYILKINQNGHQSVHKLIKK